MIFNFRKRQKKIELQERVIDNAQKEHIKTVDSYIEKQQALNKILSNGVTLEIKKAIGSKHD